HPQTIKVRDPSLSLPIFIYLLYEENGSRHISIPLIMMVKTYKKERQSDVRLSLFYHLNVFQYIYFTVRHFSYKPSSFLIRLINVSPISDGVSAVSIPHSFIMRIFSSAVPLPPEIIAPAWPIRFPGGAVCPPMKPTTGLVMLSRTHSAASSSAVPPISPIMTTAYVSGSSLKAFSTSMKFVSLSGSPPIPTAVV